MDKMLALASSDLEVEDRAFLIMATHIRDEHFSSSIFADIERRDNEGWKDPARFYSLINPNLFDKLRKAHYHLCNYRRLEDQIKDVGLTIFSKFWKVRSVGSGHDAISLVAEFEAFEIQIASALGYLGRALSYYSKTEIRNFTRLTRYLGREPWRGDPRAKALSQALNATKVIWEPFFLPRASQVDAIRSFTGFQFHFLP
ncbi:MAG TPA: hypothetical protein VI895_05455 [Bdellovibrionota bacterium]|nr:hypothetical protein [Bdellovibrionota bacterium]